MFVPPEPPPEPPLGPDLSALTGPPPPPPAAATDTSEVTAPVRREDLRSPAESLSLDDLSGALSIESASLVSADSASAAFQVEPPPPGEEATERVPRGSLSPAPLRLGDLRLPELAPLPLPTRVLPGEWELIAEGATPSGGVSAAVADDVHRGEHEELELLLDDRSVSDEPSLGAPPASDSLEEESADLSDLAELLAEASLEQDEVAGRERAEEPAASLLRAVRGEPLPAEDSMDDMSLDVVDPGAGVAGPEAWDDDDVPTRVEHPDQLAAALAMLQADPGTASLTLGVVDGAAPPSEADLATDGASLDLDTDSIEMLSLELLIDAPEERADPAVVRDLAEPQPRPRDEDDLSSEPVAARARGPVWVDLAPGVAAGAGGRALYLELVDRIPPDAAGSESAPVELDADDSVELDAEDPDSVELDADDSVELDADDSVELDADDSVELDSVELDADDPDSVELDSVELESETDDAELELEDEALPPLDLRPPEETTVEGSDSVDELLIIDEDDEGPASLVIEPAEEEEADLLAEGGAIRVDLGLGEKPAATPEEARQGVAVAPARPIRRWDGKSGDAGERTTDLVALARLQENSGAAARGEPELAPADDGDPADDDWLADLTESEPAAAKDKGDPMSPYYEDTMPGWLPGDEAGSTRGAPRPATEIGPSSTSGKPSESKD